MMRLHVRLALTFLAFCSGSVHAQSPEDILLSHNPYDSTLSTDLQIQAALEHGGHRLAVWGTQVADGDSVVGALVMNLDGVQSVLTSSDARPYGAVDIVPVGEEDFIVVWNDRRNGEPGLYSVRIGGKSRAMSSELLIDAGRSMAGRIIPQPLDADLQILYTSVDASGQSARAVHIDPEVMAVRSAWTIATTSINTTQSYAFHNGGALLRLSDNKVLLLDRSGRIDPRIVPDNRFNQHFHIVADSGLVVHFDDTIRYYRSMFDAVPDSVYVFRSPVFLIHRDSLGFYLTQFTGYTRDMHSVKALIKRRFSFNDPSDTARTTWELSSFFNAGGVTVQYDNSVVTITYLEQNVINVVVGRYFSWKRPSTTIYKLDSAISSLTFGVRSPNLFTPTVTRTASRVVSGISVRWTGSPLGGERYAEPIEPIPIERAHRQPVVLAGRGIHVGWQTENDLGNVTLTTANGPVIKRPFIPLTGNDRMVTPDGLSSQSRGPVIVTARVKNGRYDMGPEGDWARTIVNPILYILKPEGEFATVIAAGYDRKKPVGEITPRFLAPGTNPNTRTITLFLSTTVTPDFSTSEQHGGTIALNDMVQKSHWTMSLNPAPLAIVSIDSAAAFFLTDHNTLVQYPKKEPVNRRIDMRPVDSAVGEITVQIQRLFGEHILRVTYAPSSRIHTLEIYRFDGELIASRRIDVPSSLRGQTILQRPSDKAIIILRGTATGVYAMILGQRLQSLESEDGTPLGAVWISQSDESTAYPAGDLSGDTLFVAWEDYRSKKSASDIRSNWWVIPASVEIAQEQFDPLDPEVIQLFQPNGESARASSTLNIEALWPNPIRTSASVRIMARLNQMATIFVYNARGEAARRIPLQIREGRFIYPIDLSGLEAGSYALSLDGQSGHDGEMVFILGE